MDLNTFEYLTTNVSLNKNGTIGQQKNVRIPSGKVVRIGIVSAGNTENRIIDFAVNDGGNDVIKAADFRFSEKTNSGSYMDSFRPVDLDGNKEYDVRFTTSTPSAIEDVNFQVIFIVQKPQY